MRNSACRKLLIVNILRVDMRSAGQGSVCDNGCILQGCLNVKRYGYQRSTWNERLASFLASDCLKCTHISHVMFNLNVSLNCIVSKPGGKIQFQTHKFWLYGRLRNSRCIIVNG